VTQTPKENFFDAWTIYEEVLERNYMFHDQIYRGVQHFLANRYGTRLFTILDLGCGSARHLAEALRGRSVREYVGYDLSAEALDQARINLAGLGCPFELRHGEILDGLKASSDAVDLIFCSFALHHLSSADKLSFFKSAYRRLTENGQLLLIDTTREEDENLPIYLDRYCGWLRAEWKALSPAALDAICAHIRNNDFPETLSALQVMATDAGFAQGIEIDRFRWHRTLAFEKKPARRL
jgi:SAM-dependent methyltransferase